MNGMWFRLQQIDLELWKIVIIEIRSNSLMFLSAIPGKVVPNVLTFLHMYIWESCKSHVFVPYIYCSTLMYIVQFFFDLRIPQWLEGNMIICKNDHATH